MKLIRFWTCLLLACAAGAQEFRSSILGRVTDVTGAVVPGVAVMVTNVDTNVPASARTNEQGNYRVPFLLPGNYRVSVEHAGFRRIERTDVRVSLATDVSLDFVLELAVAAESITVTAATPMLNTTSADLGQVIQQTFIQNVPVSLTRNVLNRAYLDPSITYSDTTGTVTSNAQTQIVISGGGGARGRNEIIVDGIPNTVARSGGVAIFVPSQDSVEEMRVQSTLFDASYGHSNGGAINISTRSGTNAVHGTAYDFKRWRALNANSWVNNRKGLAKPPVNYNQYGGVIAGPVWLPNLYNGRNRTFFTFALESNADKAPRTRQAHVPTELERAGDFSQTRNSLGSGLVAIYDPFSTVGTGTSARRTVFPDGRIPARLLNPTGVALAKAFPLPTEITTPQIGVINWYGTGVYQVLEKQYSGRIDHQISPRQRMFGRYSRLTRGDEFIPVFFPGVFNFPVDGQADLGIQDRFFNSAALDDTISFTPTFAGSLRYGLVTRSLPKVIGVSSGRNLADPSGLSLAPIILSNQATKAFPYVTLGENFPGLGGRRDVETWLSHAALATFYKTVSNHNLRFGMDYRMTRWNRIYLGDPQSGRFAFSTLFTQANASTASTANTSGSGLASLLLGVPASGSLGYESPQSMQNHYLALFIQEDWRVRPKLTLNFGLRWELEKPYTERYNRIGYGFDYNAQPPASLKVPGLDLRGGLLFAGVNGNPRTEGNLDKNNFGPRFGFAWSLNDKTVVRGGYGLFFAAQTYNSTFQGSVATFDAVTTYIASLDNNATPATTLANPFPYGLRPAQGTTPGLGARYGDNLTVSDQYRVNPYTQQWQVSIQREFPGRILLETAYVGALTVKSPETFDLNEMPDVYRKPAENNMVNNPFLGIFDAMSLLGKGEKIPQGRLWKRYPQYAASQLWGASLSLEGAPTGRAVFHAWESRVEKRFSHGLNVNWAYTFSKLITSNTTSIINERHYRSVGAFDVKHTTRMAFVYELPFGPRKPLGASLPGALARLAEGWTVSGFLTANTGTPLSITDRTLQVAGTAGRPIRLRNAAKSGPIAPRVDAYFDTTAFYRLPDQYAVSPEPLYFDELRGPGLVSFNGAVTKDIRLVERLRVQLRAEAANLTNSPAWANPLTDISTAATFGKIQDGGAARSIQMGLKLTF
ncbi:MAG: carboxypeptidase regulatory-like domain-containing protein [Bryobacteraceae bacterium]